LSAVLFADAHPLRNFFQADGRDDARVGTSLIARMGVLTVEDVWGKWLMPKMSDDKIPQLSKHHQKRMVGHDVFQYIDQACSPKPSTR